MMNPVKSWAGNLYRLDLMRAKSDFNESTKPLVNRRKCAVALTGASERQYNTRNLCARKHSLGCARAVEQGTHPGDLHRNDRSKSQHRRISVRFVFGWELGIDGLIRVGANLKIGAMVVAVVAIFILAMGRHELDHLQGAFRAIDVRNLDVGFLLLIERRDVHEQAVGKNGA